MTDFAGEPASIGRRAGAYAIDLAILYGILLVLGGIAAGAMSAAGALSSEPGGAAAGVVGVAAALWIGGVAWVVVYTAMQGGRGSIGQRAVGLQLRDATSGEPIGFGRALLRNVIWALAASILIGYLTPLFDHGRLRQGWHDKVAAAFMGMRRVADAAASVSAHAQPLPSATAHLRSAGAPMPAIPAPVSAPFAPGSGVPPTGRPLPSAPTMEGGLISHVPGAVRAPTPATVPPPAPGPPPAPIVEATAPVAPGPAGETADDLDQTRAAAPATPPAATTRAEPAPAVGTPAVAVLAWDDGTRIAVYGRTLFGRNPAPEDGVRLVAVRDETLSLSKTHFEVGGDSAGPWIVDRHSTNGSVLVRGESSQRLIAGVQTSLRPGDRLEFGDRTLRVEAP